MTAEQLKTKSKEEIFEFIKKRLSLSRLIKHSLYKNFRFESVDREHLRFEMSGDESETGQCTVDNLEILNRFADLGIYDFTHYLFLDFYKGTPTIYLSYFWEEANLEYSLDGYGTTEIIYEVFQKTIFSGKSKRRR